MSEKARDVSAPAAVTEIIEAGFATWAGDSVDSGLRARFNSERIPVAGIRHVRVWGLQVDDERELPGHERTQIADEEIWEISLIAENGSKYAFDSTLLKPAI